MLSTVRDVGMEIGVILISVCSVVLSIVVFGLLIRFSLWFTRLVLGW